MKKKIIIASVLLLLGSGSVLAALSGKMPWTSSDPEGITGASVGEQIRISIDGMEYMPVDHTDGIYILETEENAIAMRIHVADGSAGEIDLDEGQEGVVYTGTVREAAGEMKEETTGILMDYFEWIDEISDDWELTEEERGNIREAVSDKYIEIYSSDAALKKMIGRSLMILGTVLVPAALLLVISMVIRKPFYKVVAVSACIAAGALLIFVILFHKQLHLMQNIRKDGEGVYFVNYDRELKLDDMLASGITSDDELLAWIDRAEFHGLCPVSVDTGRYGCSSFIARTPDGDVIFGRNFDYPESDTVMIYTDPEDGYASYAMADLAVIGVGREKNEMDPDSLPGRFMMLVTPYIVCDGVNEAGLGVSTLELDIGENHQDTGRPDMFVYTAIRVILDRCATVDEAVKLLEGYDIHSHAGVRQHLFIADTSGRSVVVEWFDDRMYVNERNAVTNSVLTPGDHYGEEADWRLDVILDELDAYEGILTTDQAAELLGKVCLGSMTQWSAVYDLSDFSADVYVDKHYEHAYTYGH